MSLHFLSTGRFIVLQLSVSVFTESSFNVLVVLLPTINRYTGKVSKLVSMWQLKSHKKRVGDKI